VGVDVALDAREMLRGGRGRAREGRAGVRTGGVCQNRAPTRARIPRRDPKLPETETSNR